MRPVDQGRVIEHRAKLQTLEASEALAEGLKGLGA